jgi:alkaline phosphatase D
VLVDKNESDKQSLWRSRVGRTKTAPAADEDVKVRFAVASCQDYSGRYYHAYKQLLTLDLDFVVHLGDYVYETTANPEFQNDSPERQVLFDDEAGTLSFSTSDEMMGLGDFQAARSLDNYRNLYRVYRSDPDLQAVHERFPMIVVWDDHEFSNDAWGQNATYTNDETDELDAERRANADQAWFEYMPVDYLAGENFSYEPDGEFPENLRIYRDFTFGKHLHLVMTDLRRFRADHVIAEGAFPGGLALDSAQINTLSKTLSSEDNQRLTETTVPYVKLKEFDAGRLYSVFTELEQDGDILGFQAQNFDEEISAVFVNQLLTQLAELSPDVAALEPIDVSDTSLPRGLAYHQLGKSGQYASFGSRYFLDARVFEWIAKFRYDASDGESERVMGDKQERWFLETLSDSKSTWKVWGNEYTLMRRTIDLDIPLVPEELRRIYQVSADDWDGLPNRRAKLLKQLSEVQNLVVVTGDIHSFFVGDLGVPGGEKVIEFVAGAISSATFESLLGGGMVPVAGVSQLLQFAGPLLLDNNTHLAFQDLTANGFASFEADGKALKATLHLIDQEKVKQKTLKSPLASHFAEHQFRVEAGRGQVQRLKDGAYQSWDRAEGRWL